MSEEQPTFKVTDRRLFNADGTLRDGAEEERTITEEPQILPDRVSDPSSTPTIASQSSDDAGDDPESEVPGADDPASFVNLVMSLATNAAAALGMMPHPASGKREVDPEAGKHWIDVIGMLELKTRGNLHPGEHQVIEGLLADLRMQYVSLSRASASPKPQPGFSAKDITGAR